MPVKWIFNIIFIQLINQQYERSPSFLLNLAITIRKYEMQIRLFQHIVSFIYDEQNTDLFKTVHHFHIQTQGVTIFFNMEMYNTHRKCTTPFPPKPNTHTHTHTTPAKVMSIVGTGLEVELPRIMRRRIIPCHTITNKTSLQNYHFLFLWCVSVPSKIDME